MKNSELNAWVAVISTDRPNNVKTIEKVMGCDATFYVCKGEGKFYEKCGAKNVVECEYRNISAARNQAMNDAAAQKLINIQVSDDLKKLTYAWKTGTEKMHKPISFHEACGFIINGMKQVGAKLGGTAITSNLFYFTGNAFTYDKLIVNDLIFLDGNDLQYDEEARLKEDYDMFIRQMFCYGKVCRADSILAEFPHRQNFGGANTYRTTAEEEKRNQYMLNKFPDYVQRHSTREGQISINYKALYKVAKKA